MDQAARLAALEEAASLLASDPAAAERAARRVLRGLPDDPNATLILASALRREGQTKEAIALLERQVRTYDRAAPSHYELGLALADAGLPERAVKALQKSVQLDPTNPGPWRALGAVMFDLGDARAAEAAFDGYHLALVTEPWLREAAVALYQGRQRDAEALLRPILAAHPNDPGAMNLMAEALTRLGRASEAAALLQRSLQQTPEDDEVRFRLARALCEQQRAGEALPHIERLLQADPTNPGYRNLIAGAFSQIGDFDRAALFYEDLLASHGKHAPTWTNYAHVLRIVGRSNDATSAYRRAIALDAGQGEAYLGLANLKTAAFTDEELAEIRRLSSRPQMPLTDRQQLAFALGQALEDRGDYEGAFAAYAAGAASRAAGEAWNAEAFTRFVRRSIELFDADFFAARSDFGVAAPDPIFIVGLPRAGSTLIEQILASHSQVEGIGEAPEIGFLADGLGAYPETSANLTAADARSLGDSYLASTRDRRKLGRALFIDKMPNNFQFLGLIQLILPSAKIIDARRHPMATCFSAFKQHFAQGQAYSYDLEDLGSYYRDYLALMGHFDAALPGRVCRVIYEDLVENTEAEVRRLLAHCQLEFEPACLTFYETPRPVRTVSSEQVRRPIFREGLEQWRNFDPWLDPLRDALGPALETWRG